MENTVRPGTERTGPGMERTGGLPGLGTARTGLEGLGMEGSGLFGMVSTPGTGKERFGMEGSGTDLNGLGKERTGGVPGAGTTTIGAARSGTEGTGLLGMEATVTPGTERFGTARSGPARIGLGMETGGTPSSGLAIERDRIENYVGQSFSSFDLNFLESICNVFESTILQEEVMLKHRSALLISMTSLPNSHLLCSNADSGKSAMRQHFLA